MRSRPSSVMRTRAPVSGIPPAVTWPEMVTAFCAASGDVPATPNARTAIKDRTTTRLIGTVSRFDLDNDVSRRGLHQLRARSELARHVSSPACDEAVGRDAARVFESGADRREAQRCDHRSWRAA